MIDQSTGNKDCDHDVFLSTIADLLLYQHTATFIPMIPTSDNSTEDTKDSVGAIYWH